jgi:hypothetical protein
MTADFITILTAKGRRRATKLIEPARDKTAWPYRVIPDQIDIIGYDTMSLFRGEERTVSSIYEVAKLLDSLEHDFSSFIVRGGIADGVDRSRMVRRVRTRDDHDPTLIAAEHRWIALDIDAIPCPEYIDPGGEPMAAVEHVIDQLPEEFRGVTCRWQFTSSQGFKGSTINVRLYFWADRPLSDSDLKTWLCGFEPGTKDRRWPMIDGAVFAPAQPIYTAAPIIAGVRDPMPQRSGMLFGDTDEVAAPEIAPAHRRQSSHGVHGGGPQAPGEPGLGYEGYCARIGDHGAGERFHGPIKSAVASYIARHGSQVDTTWLRADLEEVIRRAPRDPVKHPDDYVELRVDDLDPLIAAIVDFERSSEEERKANNVVNLDRHALVESIVPAFPAPMTEDTYDNFLTMVFTRFAEVSFCFRDRIAEWAEVKDNQ